MSKVSIRTSLFVAAAIVLHAGFALAAGARPGGPPRVTEVPEVSPAAASLLAFLNTAPENKLKATSGMTGDAVSKLMAFRSGGGKLKNLAQFVKVTGTDPTRLETLLKPYQEQEMAREIAADRKAVPEPPARAKAGRLQRNPAGTTADPNAGANEAGPIGAVRPGFYSKLPGYEDLDKIDPLKRTEFLETINREMCTCGCQGETVAYCLVNDPGCPVVKARAKKIYDDIMNKPPR